MTYHVLNGDSLAETFRGSGIEGEIIICREGLIDGSLHGDNLEEFWRARANYVGVDFVEYHQTAVKEFEKIISAPPDSQINLWFGYDLFCQTNMWFILSILFDSPQEKDVYVVYPTFLKPEEIWSEFGKATTGDLRNSLRNRTQFSTTDLQLGNDLWMAYKNNDLLQLEKLSRRESSCFPLLRIACQAHFDRFPSEGKKARLETVIEDIIKKSPGDFYTVFEQFYAREGVYGFGDVQFRKLYDKLMESR
jgi:hypothetical protein